MRIGQRMRCELREALGPAALARGRAQVEKASAAQRPLPAGVAQHETVARRRGDRTFEHELHDALQARADRLVGQRHDARREFGGRMMQTNRGPLAQLFRLARQQAQAGVDAVGRGVQSRIEHHVAARDGVLVDVAPGEIERAAVARLSTGGGLVLRMDAAHMRFDAGRAHQHGIADGDAAGQHRAGDDGAGAGKRERAVDREAETAGRGAAAEGMRGGE